ncbi:MAG: NUDIX domain-containing protein [Candidatus Aenigmatarchaeota archaeon]
MKTTFPEPKNRKEAVLPATKKPTDFRVEDHPDFFGHENRWMTTVNQPGGLTNVFIPQCHVEIRSPFGSVETAVVVDDDGKPVFDRPLYRESPNVNCIAWGVKDWIVYMAVIRQPRPHADNPLAPGVENEPIVFGQIPMGFLKNITGQDLKLERVEAGAVREIDEETGAGVVLEIARPSYPYHNPNPAFVATWSELVFVKVDVDRVGQLKKDHTEPIYSAEYIPFSRLRQRLLSGVDDEGAVYRMCTSNSLWLIFLAWLHEQDPDLAKQFFE